MLMINVDIFKRIGYTLKINVSAYTNLQTMNNKMFDAYEMDSELPNLKDKEVKSGFNISYNKEVQYENWTFSAFHEEPNSEIDKKLQRNKKSVRSPRCSTKSTSNEKTKQFTCNETKERFEDFGARSTAHGWGQVVNEKAIILKIMWVILTMSAYAGNGWHISLLVTQYLDYPTEQVARVRFTAMEFPSITICNIQPMSFSTGLNLLADPASKLSSWNSLTTDYFEIYNASSLGLSNEDYEYLVNRLKQPVGYFENIGNESTVVGQQINDFLIRCTFPNHMCDRANFTLYQNPSYFNCYTFNGGNRSADKLIAKTTGPQQGLSLILYLESDNGDMLYNGTYHTLSNIGNAAGIRVVIHQPDSLPTPVDNGFDVPPGYSSSIGIKITRAERLDPPIGDCRKNQSINSDKFAYSQQGCLLLCEQKIVIDNCNCMSSYLPIPDEGSASRYCGEFNISDPQFFFDNLSCEAQVTQEFATNENMRDTCNCFPLCEENTYQTDVSYSQWPLDFVQQDFYTKYVLKNPEKESMKAYNNLKNYNISELIQKGLIRKNFARINIYLKDLIVEEVIQKRTYELQNLFSDMGGTFGLWIGVSILTWFEIFEFITKLICFWVKTGYQKLSLGKPFIAQNNEVNHLDP